MPIAKDLSFTVDEYRSRVKKVQSIIAKKDIDAMLCHAFPSICYLTGIQTIGVDKYFMVLVPKEGDPVLLSQDFESHNAALGSWLDACVTYGIGEDYIEATRKLLDDRGLAEAKVGIELGSCGLRVTNYLRLLDLLPHVSFVDVSGTVEQVKVIKSPAEVEYIRQAANLSSAGMQAAVEVAGEGKTDNDLALAGYEAMIGGGSEYMCYDPIVTVGERSGIPHSTHRRIKIKKGDPIFMEFGACINRYSAPIMRTVFIGQPPDIVKRMADSCRDSVNTVIQNAKPGISGDEVAIKASRCLNWLPSHFIWHGCYAYSIGIGFPPEWGDCSTAITEGDDTMLQSGMAFHCTTSLRDPGKYGATVSETIVITDDGCEVLTDLPRELVCK